MKKLFAFSFGLFMMLGLQNGQAQENIVKVYPGGFHVFTGSGNSVNYLFKFATYERVFTDKLSGQINLGFIFNRGTKVNLGPFGGTIRSGGFTQFVIEPQVKYYMMDDAPHGLYVGGYFLAAVRSGFSVMGIGPNVGYQILFLDDRLAVDANIGAGVGFTAGSGSSNVGFEMPFQVGAGYAF